MSNLKVFSVWCMYGGSHNLIFSALNIFSEDNDSCVVVLPKWALTQIARPEYD